MLLSKDSYLLLKELGVEELDLIAEVIEEILPKYTSSPSEISAEEHYNDINKIERALAKAIQEKKDQLLNKLRSTPFILSVNKEENTVIYRKPSELYFENDDLRLYFCGNNHFGFVSPEYPESAMKLFEDLGVSDSVRIQRKETNSKNFVVIRKEHGDHKRGANGFDPDIEIEGLKHALGSPTPEKSEFIWNRIAVSHPGCIRGTVESSTKQTYEDSVKKEIVSEKFGRLLINAAWLPINGSLRKPSELRLEDLPDAFERDEKLQQKLEMRLNVVAKLEKDGVITKECVEFIELMKKHPDLVREKFQQLKKDISDQNQKPVFPERSPSDPERTQEKNRRAYRKSFGKGI